MTPLMLGKRFVNDLQRNITQLLPRCVSEPPNHMNIWRSEHPVPSELVYQLGPKFISTLRLRSGFNMAIEQISAGGESHKHSWSAFSDRRASLLIYLGEAPTQLGYTDPRQNQFEYKLCEPGETFILSQHHPFHYHNVMSETPAVWLTINAHLDWDHSVRLWQHKW